MFLKYNLPFPEIYENIKDEILFENVAKGRQGAIIASNINEQIPIIRSTTKYHVAAQKFPVGIYNLIDDINQISNLDLNFNNALVERYSEKYKKMGFHTDIQLDMHPNSYIALVSFYDNLDTECSHEACRQLIIKNKDTLEEEAIELEHGSVILFSHETNSQYLHKIVLQNSTEENNWLGI